MNPDRFFDIAQFLPPDLIDDLRRMGIAVFVKKYFLGRVARKHAQTVMRVRKPETGHDPIDYDGHLQKDAL